MERNRKYFIKKPSIILIGKILKQWQLIRKMVISMTKVKILWSGITGRTGKETQKIAKLSDYLEIVAGICRSDNKFYNYDELDKITEDYDIIVDFSHKDNFDKILSYALKVKKPFIIGASGLS